MQPQLPDDLIDILLKHGDRIATTEKSLTNDAVPIGAEFDWPSALTAKLPWNYKVADGSAQDRVALGGYFALVGTTFGAGDGSTTFNLPNYTNVSNSNQFVSYTEFTGNISVTVVAEASAPVVVTAPAFTANGTDAYWFELYTPYASPGNVAGAYFYVCLFDGSTSLGYHALYEEVASGAGSGQYNPIYVKRRLIPSAGSHTYSWRAFAGVSAGVIGVNTGGAGNYIPGYMNITAAESNTVSHVKIVKVL